MGKVIAMVSGKGGVGKTTISAELCSSLSLKHSVVGIDFDMGFRNLDILTNMQNDVVYDMGDVLKGNCSLQNALCKCPNSNFHLLAASATDFYEDMDVDAVAFVIEALKKRFDFVIVDCAAGINKSVRDICKLSDTVVIVAVPERTSLRDEEHAAKIIGKITDAKIRLVINKFNKDMVSIGVYPNIDDMIDHVGIRLVGVVPFYENLIIEQNIGKIIKKKNNKYFNSIRDIGSRLANQEVAFKKYW